MKYLSLLFVLTFSSTTFCQKLYVLAIDGNVSYNDSNLNAFDKIEIGHNLNVDRESEVLLVDDSCRSLKLGTGEYSPEFLHSEFIKQTNKGNFRLLFDKYKLSSLATTGAVSCGMSGFVQVPKKSFLFRDSIFVSWEIPKISRAEDSVLVKVALTNIYDEEKLSDSTYKNYAVLPRSKMLDKEPFFLIKLTYDYGGGNWDVAVDLRDDPIVRNEVNEMINDNIHPAILALKCISAGYNLDAQYYLHTLSSQGRLYDEFIDNCNRLIEADY